MVRSLINRKGNAVANQFVIRTEGATYFQSYSSVVACIKDGKITLSSHWDYSNTTRRNLYAFLDEYGFGQYCNKKTTENGIRDGEITLVNVSSLAIKA